MRHLPLLLLWDVDGTLIFNGGISKEAYSLAYELLTGAAPTHPVITGGQTDPAILRSLLVRHGAQEPSNLCDLVSDIMPRALEALIPRLREVGGAMPGAREAIDRFASEPDVVQSVLTGNVVRNALSKLTAFGLHEGIDFDVGGFGSDSETRANLVGMAQRRAAGKYGAAFDGTNTVLVGDTPRDIEAGHVGGARVVAVATGDYDVARLYEAGAEVVLHDLRSTEDLVKAVTSVVANLPST